MFVIISGTPNPDLRINITGMANALRGATGKLGIWYDEKKGFAAAGIARGIQPEDVYDAQPYVDDQICFVADGSIDNRAEVAAMLNISSGQLAAMSDSELLYRAYRQHAENLTSTVYGHYAFAALHRDTGRVVLSDDHIGTMGVYYAERGGSFIAATQMGAMLAHPRVDRLPDLTTLPVLIGPKMLDGTTAIRDVSLIVGGDYVRYQPGKPVSVEKWWHPESLPKIHYKNEREYVDQASHLLNIAVGLNLHVVGGASTTLSGGLDSSLVTAFAARYLAPGGTRITAYTSVPEEGVAIQTRSFADNDESELARDLVRMHPNTDHILIRPDGTCALDLIPEIHALSHTAVRNTTNHIWVHDMLKRTRALGNRVLLVGVRGNAITSLEGSIVIDSLLQSGRWGTALQLAHRELAQGGDRPLWRIVAAELRTRYRQFRGTKPKTKARPGEAYFQPEYRKKVQHLFDEKNTGIREFEGWLKFAASGRRFCASDPMVHTGVEMRDPLANRRFLETLLAYPVESQMIGGRARGMARAMGEGIVPDSIRLRRRRGVQSAEVAGLVQRDIVRYRESLQSLQTSPACMEIFDLEVANSKLESIANGETEMASASTIERLVDVGTLIKEMGV